MLGILHDHKQSSGVLNRPQKVKSPPEGRPNQEVARTRGSPEGRPQKVARTRGSPVGSTMNPPQILEGTNDSRGIPQCSLRDLPQDPLEDPPVIPQRMPQDILQGAPQGFARDSPGASPGYPLGEPPGDPPGSTRESPRRSPRGSPRASYRGPTLRDVGGLLGDPWGILASDASGHPGGSTRGSRGLPQGIPWGIPMLKRLCYTPCRLADPDIDFHKCL